MQPQCRMTRMQSPAYIAVWCWPGAGPATPTTRRSCPRSDGCRGGGAAGWSRWSTAGSPRRTWPTCAAPAGTTSPASGCATAPRTPPRHWPGRVATSRSATTCGSRRSASNQRRECGGSSATTPRRPKDAARRRGERGRAELDRITAARAQSTRPAEPPQGKAAAAGEKAGARRPRTSRPSARCATTRPSGRWLRQTPSGRLMLDRRQGRRRGTAGRQVPAVHLRPGPVRRGRRAGLQEPAGGRTRVPRPEVHPRAAPGVPPARTPHPRPRAAVLAGAAADPGRRTAHRADLARDQPASSAGCTPSPCRAGRHRRADHRAHRRPVEHSSGLRARPAAPDHHPRPRLSSANALTTPRRQGGTRRPPTHARSSQVNATDSALTSAHQLRNSGEGSGPKTRSAQSDLHGFGIAVPTANRRLPSGPKRGYG